MGDIRTVSHCLRAGQSLGQPFAYLDQIWNSKNNPLWLAALQLAELPEEKTRIIQTILAFKKHIDINATTYSEKENAFGALGLFNPIQWHLLIQNSIDVDHKPETGLFGPGETTIDFCMFFSAVVDDSIVLM